MITMETVQRDTQGRFTSKKSSSSNPPDLVNFRITNPIVYIKYWWKRIMANEGIEFRLKVKPITALAIATIAFSLAFGLGAATKENSITQAPTPTPNLWKETALKGTLKEVEGQPMKYFLLGSGDEAITLEIGERNLATLSGKRVLAVGSYNQKQKILVVTDLQNLEVLPSTTPTPTPTPTYEPSPTQTPPTASL